jgi:hypothetical protein
MTFYASTSTISYHLSLQPCFAKLISAVQLLLRLYAYDLLLSFSPVMFLKLPITSHSHMSRDGTFRGPATVTCLSPT